MLPLLLLYCQSYALQRKQVKKSIGKIVPKYILKPTKGHTGWANTYKPRFELLKQLKSNSLKDLKVVNFEVKDGELETYAPVNSAALQTIKQTFNKTESEMERLKVLAPLVNKGMHLSTLSQVDLEAMDEMGLLDKKWQQGNKFLLSISRQCSVYCYQHYFFVWIKGVITDPR